MAFHESTIEVSRPAAADLSAKQFYAVELDSNGKVNVCNAAGDAVFGILQNDPASGDAALVAIFGPSKCWLGGTVAAGDLVAVTSAGKIVAATNDYPVIGRCIVGGADGEIGTVMVNPMQVNRGTRGCFTIPCTLANVTGTGDVVTGITPGFAGTIQKLEFVTTTIATDNAAVAFNLEIGTTNVTGGALSLSDEACGTLGEVTAATAITAANTFTASDTISIEATVTTAFTQGEGAFMVWYSA